MKDRSKYGATRASGLIVAALILVGGAGLTRADEPADKNPAEEATASPAASVADAPVAGPPSTAPSAMAEAPASTPVPAPAPAQSPSWFARPPLALVAGEGDRQFKLTVFGFAEVDYIYDTTRSYDDAIGSSLVAPKNTYNGNHSRSQFSMRNSRLGFAFESPTVGGIAPAAVLEADFFGHQASPPATSENTYFDSPTFRVRHAYVKMATPYVNVLLGQTYDLFGWQNFSSPCSLQFLGLPNQLFSRNPQLRVSSTFGAEGPVGVEVAVSAGRPAQRDSQIPDGSAGLRMILNHWTGITT
ncbi:MAG TPA: hypothetical protein VF518_06465, partial [Polyangia bacterium]